MSDKELKQIFQEIAHDCHEHECCRGCKFYMDDECILNGYPDSWKLYKFKTDKWDTLYNWLNDTRLAIAPVFTAEVKEYNIRAAKVELIDEIMEYMEELEEEKDDET